MATIYTDSRMTLDSLKNSKIHTFLIEEIRKLTQMGKINWKIQLCRVKAHVGIQGNELADTRKGGGDEYGHHGMLQESSKKCSEK